MSKLKVLHLIKSLGRGGAEMLLPETIAMHDKTAFEFHVIYFLPWKDQLVESIQHAGATVTCLEASNNIRILLQVRKVISYVQQHQITLIHCHLPWAGFLGRLVHLFTGVPVVYTEHNKQERYHGVTKFINKISFHYQSAVLAVSEEVAESIEKNIHPKVPVHVVLNGVDTGKFVTGCRLPVAGSELSGKDDSSFNNDIDTEGKRGENTVVGREVVGCGLSVVGSEKEVVGCGLSVVGSELSGEDESIQKKDLNVIEEHGKVDDSCGKEVVGSEYSGDNDSLQVQKDVQESVIKDGELKKRNWEVGRSLRKEFVVMEDEILIGTIAVFRFQKRLELWLVVFAELKKKYPRIKGVLVGDGPLMGVVKDKRKELKLDADVLLPGLQTNTVDWFSAMDVYLMSSEFEGLPVALLEAMSCSLPVVCTKAGGIGEVVRDGVEGFLVPVDQPMELVEPLGRLVGDAVMRQRMGVAARERVVEGFGMGRMVTELESLYRLYVK